MYQHIEFIDGSNPYICKTDRDFRRMKERYELEPIKEGFWKATFKREYLVVGWTSSNAKATFYKMYQTKSGAMRRIKRAIANREFESVVLSRRESYLRNNENLLISINSPIKCWESYGEVERSR